MLVIVCADSSKAARAWLRSISSRIWRSATEIRTFNKPDIERLGEVIVRARFERLFQVLGIGLGRDQQDKHFVALRPRAQFAAKLNPTFPRQHPVEDQEGEVSRRQRGFGFLGAAHGRHLMAALGNKPLQIAAAAGMIFDKQNFHSGEAKTDVAPGLTATRRHFAQAE